MLSTYRGQQRTADGLEMKEEEDGGSKKKWNKKKTIKNGSFWKNRDDALCTLPLPPLITWYETIIYTRLSTSSFWSCHRSIKRSASAERPIDIYGWYVSLYNNMERDDGKTIGPTPSALTPRCLSIGRVCTPLSMGVHSRATMGSVWFRLVDFTQWPWRGAARRI